jgi:hypothetical protein
MVATAVIGSAVVGAGSQMMAADKAAGAQRDAANQANARLQGQYDQMREDLSPFRQVGVNALLQLENRLPTLAQPIEMDQAALEKTPGYQFTKTQGLKAVQNAAAARGLGASGSAMKGAATFATGLADQTYRNQFDMANINQTNAYNRLMGLVTQGQNSAAQTGSMGNQLAGQQSQNMVGAGDAQAAAYNKMGTAAQGAANQIGGYYTYQGLYGNNPLTGGSSVGGYQAYG